MTEQADWTKRGVVFYGGSMDGKLADVFPAEASLSMCNEVAGKEIYEEYARTDEASDSRTIFRFVRARPDLEDDETDDDWL
jgi:hypothetical protein